MQIPGFGFCRAKMRAACVGTDGAATVEAVIWLPAFFAVFALITDASTIFGRESQVLRVIQDANRNLSTGYWATTAEARTDILSRIGWISPNAVVTTEVVGNVITTSVALPLADLTATGLVAAFSSGSLTVSATHVMEEE